MIDPSCTFAGNPEFYGLGIRLGVYTQLLSTLLANHWLPAELSSAWDANFVFLAALLIATIKSAASVPSLLAVEVFILLQMMLAFLLSVFTTAGSFLIVLSKFVAALLEGLWFPDDTNTIRFLSELAQAHSDGSILGGHLRGLLFMAVASFNVWF